MPDAADSHRRSPPGTAKGKDRSPIFPRNVRSAIGDRLEKKRATILFLIGADFPPLCFAAIAVKRATVQIAVSRSPFIAIPTRLSCHLCGHTAAVPKKCPACGKDALIYSGFGTEKVESTVSAIFPNAVVSRMDADSMTRKEAFRETLRAFSGRKDRYPGRDPNDRERSPFSEVTLVGIINAIWRCICPIFARRTHLSVAYPGGGTRRSRRNAGRSLCAKLTPRFQPFDSICATSRFCRATSSRNWNFASVAIFHHLITRS